MIDLKSFHKTKLRIETELRNSEMANDIMDTYCSDGVPFKEVNPLLATDGVFPLIKFIYEHDGKGPIETCWQENCKLTEAGEAIWADMCDEGKPQVKKIQFGNEEGSSLATPTQMHLFPARSWRAIEKYLNARSAETEIVKGGTWSKIRRHTKHWLRTKLSKDVCHQTDSISEKPSK